MIETKYYFIIEFLFFFNEIFLKWTKEPEHIHRVSTVKTFIFTFFLKQKVVAEFYLKLLANGGALLFW